MPAFFSFVWRALDTLRKVLHLIVLLVLFLGLAAALSPSIPIVPHKTALVIAPQGTLVEQLAGDPFDRAIAELYGQQRAETLVRDLVDAIEAAKTDKRVEALVLDLGHMAGGGVAKLEEVAAAIRDFRTSGKKVLAYGEGFDQAQYYIAAQADEIYLDPQGLVLIDGFGYYRTFLKGVIDKLAVDVNVFRAGKFKSYTDQFSRSDMAETEEEESLTWLNALWAQYQAGVVKARSLDDGAIADVREQLRRARPRQQRGDLAAVALEKKLVTDLKSRREFEDQMKGLVGEDEEEHTFRGIPHWDYLAAVRPARRAASRWRSRRRSGRVRRDSRWRATAGHGRLGFARAPAARGLARGRHQSSRAAHRQPGRQRVRFRSDPPRGRCVTQGRQAGGRLDEQRGSVRRLLHRDGRRRDLGEPGDAHRLDRRVRRVPDRGAHAQQVRRHCRRHRHDAACRLAAVGSHTAATPRRRSCSRQSSTRTANSSSTSPPRARNRSTTSTQSRKAACGPASTRLSTGWSIISARTRMR